MRTPIVDGQSIDQFIPKHLRDMFYDHPMPKYKYAVHDGYAPYSFTTDGLVLYLPLWALEGRYITSVDAYKYLCTVAGALWRPNGRYFDGVNDYITIPHSASLSDFFAGGGTIEAWVNPASDGEGNKGTIVSKGGANLGWKFYVEQEAAGKVKLSFRQNFSTTEGLWTTIATVVPINTWTHVTLEYDNGAVGNNPTFRVNGAAKANTETSTPAGTRYIGTYNPTVGGVGGDFVFENLIGEVRIYSRTLVLSEIQHIYQATKWRYS